MPSTENPTNAGLSAASGHRTRGSVARACAGLTATLAFAMLLAGSAHAGEWVQVSCINPNQTTAGSQGWSSFAAGGGFGSDNSTSCGPGSPMFALLSTDAPVAVGSAETLEYTPPAGSTLTGAQLDIGLYANGHGYNASGTAIAYTPEYVYPGDVFFQCAAGLQPCANATNEYIGVLEIPADRGGDLYLSAGCGGDGGEACDEGGSNGAWSMIDLWWANMRLQNSSTPAASGIGGTLLDGVARGSEELTFTASDYAGPGVYDVSVQADGETLYSDTPESNDGQCVPAGSSGRALMFDSSQPCKQSESVDLTLDTSALRDGAHTLKVTVTDAAGNSSVVYDAPINSDNAPADSTPPEIQASSHPQSGETLSAEHGQWSAPTGAGAITYSYQWQDCNGEGEDCEAIQGAEGSTYTPTSSDAGHSLRVAVSADDSDGSNTLQSAATPAISAPALPAVITSATTDLTVGTPAALANGTNASRDAQLHLDGQTRLSRAYANRALTITGALTDSTGTPIGGATLEVDEQRAGRSSSQLVGHATTAANGTFTFRAAPGTSRTLQIGYRAYSTDAADSAQASVRETVSAGVALHISPSHTRPTGTITLEGQVEGPVPSSGVYVELLVYYHRAWQPFRDPHTTGSGRFRVRYQFQGASGRFPFRAQALGGQTGFPYATGASKPVTVITS